MDSLKSGKQRPMFWLIWFLEGIIVGFGAILPGISGGTLCVAFGMYRPIIEAIANLREGLKKNGVMLVIFGGGIGAGFMGLSGLAAWLMDKNTVLVTCAFIGFIIGTIPELWQDAGEQGRGSKSYIAMGCAFVLMLAALTLLKTKIMITIEPGLWGYVLCGLLWGLSFIVPGLSSSSLLLFFGLYQPMLRGIAVFDLSVLIPMGAGMAVCVLLLSKAVGYAYQKYYSVISHGVLGIVAATAVMILPPLEGGFVSNLVNGIFIVGGAILSYCFTCLCRDLKERS